VLAGWPWQAGGRGDRRASAPGNTQRLHYGWLQWPQNSVINRTFGFEDFRSLAAATGVDRAGTATRFYALGTSTDATGPDGR